MFKLKVLFSTIFFSISLILTSIIKNETRENERKINKISKDIILKEKDLHESQMEFSYLTSPSEIEKKIQLLDYNNYNSMEFSQIFLSIQNFLDLQNKFANKEAMKDEKK